MLFHRLQDLLWECIRVPAHAAHAAHPDARRTV
jgi:hypothetical protein